MLSPPGMGIGVRVEGTGRLFSASPGDDLLEVFQKNGEPISTSCGGVASCGLCRISVVSGATALVAIKSQELVHLGNVAKVIGLRLACQAQVRADIEMDADEVIVRIPEVEDVAERKRRKAERLRHTSSPTDGHAPSSVRAATIEWRPGRMPTPENGREGKGGT